MTEENKILCLIACTCLDSADFILMSWVVRKNSTWPSRRVQMVGWSKALPVPEPSLTVSLRLWTDYQAVRQFFFPSSLSLTIEYSWECAYIAKMCHTSQNGDFFLNSIVLFYSELQLLKFILLWKFNALPLKLWESFLLMKYYCLNFISSSINASGFISITGNNWFLPYEAMK